MPDPLVSTFVTSYNNGRFILETLESMRGQTYANTELVILDDCSADGSVEIIDRWIREHGVRCTFVKHAKNMGICATVNEILSLCTGKYVTSLGSDDVWMPDHIERRVRMLEAGPPDVGIAYADAIVIDEEGRPQAKRFIEAHRRFERVPEGDVFLELSQGNFIPSMTMVVRRACFDRAGPYDERLVYDDWDMLLRIARDWKFAFDPVIGAKYRVVSTSATRALLGSRTSRVLRSDIIIHTKILDSGRLDPPRVLREADVLVDMAVRLARQGDAEGRAIAREAVDRVATLVQREIEDPRTRARLAVHLLAGVLRSLVRHPRLATARLFLRLLSRLGVGGLARVRLLAAAVSRSCLGRRALPTPPARSGSSSGSRT